MAKGISEGTQRMIELVGTSHWDELKYRAEERAQQLRDMALNPAVSPMDFYAKEAYAKSAKELMDFFLTVEYYVRQALSPVVQYDT